MTEDTYNRAKKLQETVPQLKAKLTALEELKTVSGIYVSNNEMDPLHPLIWVAPEGMLLVDAAYIIDYICKEELSGMFANIKNRLRAEINNLETEFHEL